MASFAEFIVNDWVAYVVGQQNVQKGLLASFLEREFGFFCQVAENEQDQLSAELVGDRRLLLLRECSGDDAEAIVSYIDGFGNRLLEDDKIYVGLINLDSALDIEETMLRRGVRGVVNANVASTLLRRFVLAIVVGELWFPRQLVSRCILESRGADSFEDIPPMPIPTVSLSGREREVLIEIGIGSTNDQIADHLCISQHTVKSHIYRIFRKINVPNRLQAALWASKYLS
ncbi:MAG: LuxR C-terminal-related transcriptional regulator [Pseudomonadota bacterium]|nr:LuxR C-terminal-related transcriptional regulator [Pseudomonadota bacterium]